MCNYLLKPCSSMGKREEHGFALHKGTFCDALCLWYSRQPPQIPVFVAGVSPLAVHLQVPFPPFSITNCDFTACVMSEYMYVLNLNSSHSKGNTYHMLLHPLKMELVLHRVSGQRAIFNVRVFNPNVHSYCNLQLYP